MDAGGNQGISESENGSFRRRILDLMLQLVFNQLLNNIPLQRKRYE